MAHTDGIAYIKSVAYPTIREIMGKSSHSLNNCNGINRKKDRHPFKNLVLKVVAKFSKPGNLGKHLPLPKLIQRLHFFFFILILQWFAKYKWLVVSPNYSRYTVKYS